MVHEEINRLISEYEKVYDENDKVINDLKEQNGVIRQVLLELRSLK